jgi:hypothetical protein
MRSEIRLEFDEREDKDGKKYYLCKPALPANVDLAHCVLFFWPDELSLSIALERPKKPQHDEGHSGKPPIRSRNSRDEDY